MSRRTSDLILTPRAAPHVPRAYAYLRVSTDQQDMGFEAQATICRNYWTYKRGINPILPETLHEVPDKGRSAFKRHFLKRPGGVWLDERLRSGDHVVVAKLDRMFRRTSDALLMVPDWLARGINLHILDMNIDMSVASGRMMLTLLVAIAEFESGRRSERMLEANRERIVLCRPKAGQKSSNASWGYRKAVANWHICPLRITLLEFLETAARERMLIKDLANFLNARARGNRHSKWAFWGARRRHGEWQFRTAWDVRQIQEYVIPRWREIKALRGWRMRPHTAVELAAALADESPTLPWLFTNLDNVIRSSPVAISNRPDQQSDLLIDDPAVGGGQGNGQFQIEEHASGGLEQTHLGERGGDAAAERQDHQPGQGCAVGAGLPA